jgi:hypothetical protein
MLRLLALMGAVLMVGTIALGVDYSMAAKGREDYALDDHIADRFAQVQIPGLTRTGLAAALPDAPEGWSVRDGLYDDFFLLMDKQPTAAERTVLLELENRTISDVPGFENARSFMKKGDQIVVTDISFFPANTRELKVVRFYRDVMAAALRQSSPEPVYSLFGLQFVRLTGPEFANAAYYAAVKDDGLYVSLVTNLDAASALALLSRFDSAALIAKLQNDPTLDQPVLVGPPEEPMQICVRKGTKRTCHTVTN